MAELHEISETFRAMNTDVFVAVNTSGARERAGRVAIEAVKRLFEESEMTMSRFLSSSELSRLNSSAGRPFTASPKLFEVIAEAIKWASDSGGIFDPTVLGALARAGYDRSFEQLAPPDGKLARATNLSVVARPGLSLLGDGQDASDVAPRGRPASDWSFVRLDPSTSTVLLPADSGLDLGGIGKGWAVDRAARLLRPFKDFAVDAGGDLYAAGVQADGNPWVVAVDDPFQPGQDLMTLVAHDRGVATSTVGRRRWEADGLVRHHLIDPRTGMPSESGSVAVTVVASTVTRAEILAKVALLLGPAPGQRYLQAEHGVEWVMVSTSGQVSLSRGLEDQHAA